MKASASGTGAAVGALEGTMGAAVGRGTDGQHNRTLLSFDTSAVPDDATITRAYVTVSRAGRQRGPVGRMGTGC